MSTYLSALNELCDEIDAEIITKFNNTAVAKSDINLLIAALHHVADRLINGLTIGVNPDAKDSYETTLERVNAMIVKLSDYDPTVVNL